MILVLRWYQFNERGLLLSLASSVLHGLDVYILSKIVAYSLDLGQWC